MYRFEVIWWDIKEYGPNSENGYVVAKSYAKAMKKITNFYGKGNIIDVKIYEVDDILLDEDIADRKVTPCEDRRPAGDVPV